MKPRTQLLAPLAAALLLGACNMTANHWEPVSAAERSSFAFMAADGSTPMTIQETSTAGSKSMTLTMRRYFFNDNPDNPLQAHRDDPYDRYVPIWHMPKNAVLDVVDITADAGVRLGQGFLGLLWMPWQLVAGTSPRSSYEAPPDPSAFEVENN